MARTCDTTTDICVPLVHDAPPHIPRARADLNMSSTGVAGDLSQFKFPVGLKHLNLDRTKVGADVTKVAWPLTLETIRLAGHVDDEHSKVVPMNMRGDVLRSELMKGTKLGRMM